MKNGIYWEWHEQECPEEYEGNGGPLHRLANILQPALEKLEVITGYVNYELQSETQAFFLMDVQQNLRDALEICNEEYWIFPVALEKREARASIPVSHM